MAKPEKENSENILKAAIKVRAKDILRSEGPQGLQRWLNDMPADSRQAVVRDINW